MISPSRIFYVVTWLASSMNGYAFEEMREFGIDKVETACTLVEYLDVAQQRAIRIYAVQVDGKSIIEKEGECDTHDGAYFFKEKEEK